MTLLACLFEMRGCWHIGLRWAIVALWATCWIYKTRWRKSIWCLAKPRVLSFPSTRFINSKIHLSSPTRLILIVRLFATACDCPARQFIKWSHCHLRRIPGIFDCSVRRLNMVEDPRSPPHNRFCDCSRSLRLVVQDCLRLSRAIDLIQVANWS